ncbi:NADP-dependent oxidoreductase [Georgenia sp. MJ173]|uniref:NADP-dependent oxidoreductase n=1 Tax=Georgenia sunbinii TaxID=3117728 RepID=UPI002F260D28
MTFSQFGDNSVLEMSDVPVPKVGPGQILVKVTRAAVNPVDWKVMAGGLDAMMDTHFPAIPGWDMAGVVAQVGPDTPEFSVGDRVAAYARKIAVSGGTFAEYVTIPAEFAGHVPDGVTDDQAAALPLAGLTALRSIEALALSASDTVLLHAASGGVGHVASQLAVATGARVIGTASPRSFERLEALGVTPVAYGDGLEARLRDLAPEGVDAVADFAGDVLDTTLAVLNDGGRHVSITDPRVTDHGGRWLWVRPDGPRLAELLQRVADGGLQVHIDRTFPLDEVAEAFRVSQEGEAHGKLVIDVER